MDELEYSHVGERIVSRIKDLRFKQADLCRETGLSATAISQYCTGKRIPDTGSLHKIALVLQTSMEWLLTGNEPTYIGLPEAGILPDGFPLSRLENSLISMYRVFNLDEKKEIFDFVYFKYTRLTTGGEESNFWTYFDEDIDEKSSPNQSILPESKSLNST